MSERIGNLIREYRNKVLKGKCIDLVPLSEKDMENVVELRNKEKNRYFLNQTYTLTVEGQLRWYQTYLERDNDIYWSIYSKAGQFVGTVRIYDIDEEKDLCTQGSFIIDDEFAEEAPYAIEAELLSLDFVFDVLHIGNVINEDRADNKVMNNLTRKLGFVFQNDTVVNGVDYKYYLLNPEGYQRNRQKFLDVVLYWCER
ncbi:MAG: GNAT family N-acetyltransferase [Lachnospiraceae bacterium]|nr:GNAT family N-acetyltransferase [Lachnospiraceae bacterium]